MLEIIKKNKDLFFSIILGVLLSLLSSLNPFSDKIIGTDTYVFQYGGISMLKGLVPYKDFFDHKGPIIYIINMLGILINNKIGIWIIELLCIIISIFYAKKTLDFFSKNNKLKIFTIFVCFTFYINVIEGGNLTEEYALPFLIISQYIFVKYLKNKTLKNLEILFTGFCCGIVTFLRINMIGLWIGYIIIIIYELLKKKEYKITIKYSVIFLFGFLLLIIPNIIYLYYNNALSYFWQDYILFNFKYTSVTFFEKFYSFKYFMLLGLVLETFLINIYIIKNDKKSRNFLVANLINFIINLISISLSGKTYLHYSIILLANFYIPLLIILENVYIKKEILYISISYLLIKIVVPNTLNYVELIENMKTYDDSYQKYLVNYIIENTNISNSISVYGNQNYLYVLSNRSSASKYSYLTPIATINPEIFNEYKNEIIKNKPELIIFTAEDEMSNMLKEIIIESGYQEGEENIYSRGAK